MGRKKKYNSKKKKQQTKIDIALITTIIASLLAIFLIYTKSGVIGVFLNSTLGGLIGNLRYILPLGTLIIGLKIAIKNDDYLGTKLTEYVVLMLCLSIVLSVYNVDIKSNIEQIVKDSYADGANGIGGGALGTLAAIPLIKLLDNIGAMILGIGVSAVLTVFTFNIPILAMFNFLSENFLASQKAKREEREKMKTSTTEEKSKSRVEEILGSKVIVKAQEIIPEDNIKINLNGRILEEKEPRKDLFAKKEKEDKTPIEQLAHIEGNLFKKQEEVKEDKTKEVLVLEHAMTVEDENYEYPPVEILSLASKKTLKGGAKALTDTASKLQKTLHSFGVAAKVENVSVGPVITRYELKPAEGVRVSKIANLADDIALNLAAETIRIEAPIPGKQAVGIEVPNKDKESVFLREVIESEEFRHNKSKLSVALGKDVAGNTVIADIAKMPHVLVAGSTGSGKSVCINTIITSIIYNAKPSEVKLVMVDPKVVELSVYNGIPHLLIPVVTDPKKAAGALAWAVQEMDNRYNEFAKKGVRDLKGYNEVIAKDNNGIILPQIVIIIDELADLMMVAAKDVEDAICRLAQKARAAGMHLVIATQRPSVDVITGLIKANVPSRIAFAVSSQVDSRTIIDGVGAEKLLGKGDMLFYPAGATKPTRVQGAFVSDKEVEKIVDFIKSNGEAKYSEDILESIEKGNKTDKELAEQAEDSDTDPFLMEAIDIVVETGQASTSFIQRRFKVGYARAGRIIDQIEERGIISRISRKQAKTSFSYT